MLNRWRLCGQNYHMMDPNEKIQCEKKLKTIEKYRHHQKEQLCHTRPPYRKGKKSTAVKVFTIADESFYLLIQKVPTLSGVNIEYDLKSLCYKYGQMVNFEMVDYPNNEPFTNTYLIKYESIVDAIKAKKRLDDYEFFGSLLHVSYAPELETPQETLNKLISRQRYVNIKMAQFQNLISK